MIRLKPSWIKKRLFYKFQSGFRSRFSTDTCLIHLTDFIKFQMDKGHYVGMVLKKDHNGNKGNHFLFFLCYPWY